MPDLPFTPGEQKRRKQSVGSVRELGACKEEVILLSFLILRYLEIYFPFPLCTLLFVAWGSPGISILHEA